MIAAVLLLNLLLAASPISAVEDSLPPRTDDAIPALRDGRWEDAAGILEKAVAANALDGRARYYLSAAYRRLGRHPQAIVELRAALELGSTGNRNGMRAAHLDLAHSLAATGDAGGALSHLKAAWADWGFDGLLEVLEDEDFRILHDDPRLRTLAGLDSRADADDRDARWRADLRYFRRLLAAAHPEPFHSVDEASWNAQADELDRRIGELSDLQVTAGLMRLAAAVGDGHTAVYPPSEGDLAWHLLPFFPFRLADGWYVAAAAPEHADLVGGRILEAAGRDWESIVGFTGSHLARDNDFTQRWLAAIGLQLAEPYALATAAADHAPSLSAVELVVEQADGRIVRRSLEPHPFDRDANAHWAPGDWPTAFERTPLWLRDPTVRFHHEVLGESGVLYARLLQTADSDEKSLEDFGRELRERFAKSDARALVLDLRLNNGGDANEARGLVDELIRIPALEKPGAFTVLIGPRTYSATGYLLGMFEKHLAPIFVGWPSGCRPVSYSSERSFRLPYSGLSGSISYELRIDGDSTDDHRPSFVPDYLVWPTGQDLRSGRDPVLATALAALR